MNGMARRGRRLSIAAAILIGRPEMPREKSERFPLGWNGAPPEEEQQCAMHSRSSLYYLSSALQVLRTKTRRHFVDSTPVRLAQGRARGLST
jgi:hypothetical protein